MTVDISAHSIWSERIDRIRERSKNQLASIGLSDKEQRRLTRLVLVLISDTNAKIGDSLRSADQYTRPMPQTLWSEKFDESRSSINLPITRQLLRLYAKALNISKPWSAGYLLALAVLDLFEQLSSADITNAARYRVLDNVFEHEEEMYAFVESMLGKAEEAIYKADILSEQARHGRQSQRPADESWEPRIEKELKAMGYSIKDFRFQSGKKVGRIRETALANRLFVLINSDKPPLHFPESAVTIRRHLPNILARLNIQNK